MPEDYQSWLSVEVAKLYLDFVEDKYPGEVNKLSPLRLIVHHSMLAWQSSSDNANSSALAAVAKSAANELLQITGDSYDHMSMPAIAALAKFAEEGGTRQDLELTLHYHERLYLLMKKNPCGMPIEFQKIEVEKARAKLRGKPANVGSEERDNLVKLSSLRNFHEEAARDYGENSTLAIGSLINVAEQLLVLMRFLDAQRILVDAFARSSRILGPSHVTTLEAKKFLDVSEQRRVMLFSEDCAEQYQVLELDEEEQTYLIKGPITVGLPEQRNEDEEVTRTVSMSDVRLYTNTPVFCHGLIKAQHLNGMPGEARDYNADSCRYAVHFEDQTVEPATVRGANLRIALVLPEGIEKNDRG